MAESLATSPDKIAGHSRIQVLDALRGIAALIVVLHHLDLTVDRDANPPYVEYLLHQTALHVLVGGRAPVLLFFLLSGFALSLSFRERPGARFSYSGYLIKRICRLMIPCVAAILLSAVMYAAVRPQLVPQLSEWFNAAIWNTELNWKRLLLNLAMTGRGADTSFDCVLWSLVIELRISLIFPLLYLLARGRTWAAATVSAAMFFLCKVLLIRAGNYFPLYNNNVNDALEIVGYYAPLFILGILVREHFEAVQSYLDRVARPWMLTAGVAALAGGGYLAAQSTDEQMILGALMVLLACVCVPDLSRAFSIKPLAWLGRISYSLYLVHIPVLGAVFHLFYGKANYYALALAVLVLSLLLAEVFHRLVESPSILLGRRLTASKPAIIPAIAAA